MNSSRPESALAQIQTFRFHGSAGLTLACDIAGAPSGSPVVLLHGGGQTRHSWSTAMERLAALGYRVLSFDARGHGDSDWSSDGDYSVFAFAADLTALLTTLDRPAALVGASLGALASFYAVGASDSRLATALVMVDIALRPRPAGADRIGTFMTSHSRGFGTLEEAAAAIASYRGRPPRLPSHQGLRKNLRLRSDGRLHWHWDPRLLDGVNTSSKSRYEALVAVSGRVTIPLLLARGQSSDVLRDEEVADLRSHVPQTELLELEGVGHMVVGDRNDAFNEGVINFLMRHHPPL